MGGQEPQRQIATLGARRGPQSVDVAKSSAPEAEDLVRGRVWTRRRAPGHKYGHLTDRIGAVGVAPAVPIVPVQPDHQQGFPEMKFCIACHLGGALLRGFTVSRNDSSAPHSPYLLGL